MDAGILRMAQDGRDNELIIRDVTQACSSAPAFPWTLLRMTCHPAWLAPPSRSYNGTLMAYGQVRSFAAIASLSGFCHPSACCYAHCFLPCC